MRLFAVKSLMLPELVAQSGSNSRSTLRKLDKVSHVQVDIPANVFHTSSRALLKEWLARFCPSVKVDEIGSSQVFYISPQDVKIACVGFESWYRKERKNRLPLELYKSFKDAGFTVDDVRSAHAAFVDVFNKMFTTKSVFSLKPFGIFRFVQSENHGKHVFYPSQDWLRDKLQEHSKSVFRKQLIRAGFSEQQAQDYVCIYTEYLIEQLVLTGHATIDTVGTFTLDRSVGLVFNHDEKRSSVWQDPAFEEFIRILRRAFHTQSGLVLA